MVRSGPTRWPRSRGLTLAPKNQNATGRVACWIGQLQRGEEGGASNEEDKSSKAPRGQEDNWDR